MKTFTGKLVTLEPSTRAKASSFKATVIEEIETEAPDESVAETHFGFLAERSQSIRRRRGKTDPDNFGSERQLVGYVMGATEETEQGDTAE